MRRKIFILAFLLTISSPALSQEKDKAPGGSADNGYKVYMKYQCYTCHGTVGQGADRGTGPRLAPQPMSYASFVIQLRTPRQDMPAYRKAFVTDEEVADMYAYLVSIKPSPAVKEIPLLDFSN